MYKYACVNECCGWRWMDGWLDAFDFVMGGWMRCINHRGMSHSIALYLHYDSHSNIYSFYILVQLKGRVPGKQATSTPASKNAQSSKSKVIQRPQ
jgi:hypothetical protein